MASIRDEWREITPKERAQARKNSPKRPVWGLELPGMSYLLDFREGWAVEVPSQIVWRASYKGVRPTALCSDRVRKSCMREGGECRKCSRVTPADIARRKELFRECRRYCLQQEIVLAERPKKLKVGWFRY